MAQPMSPQYQPRKPSRWPIVVVGVLLLVLVAAVAIGALLVIRRMNDPADPSTVPTGRPARPEAVQFRRVLTAVGGGCASPSAGEDRSRCGPDGFRYTLGEVEIDGRRITAAKATPQQGAAGWVVTLRLDREGSRRFAELTTELATAKPPTNQVAIVVDDKIVTAPAVSGPITGGEIQIAGNYGQKQAEELARQITG